MNRQAMLPGIIDWLREEAEDLSRLHFDEEKEPMPPVKLERGRQEDFDGVVARYYRSERRIEFSPGFLDSCWKGKKRIWDYSRARDILKHELVHAWVDWKGKWSDFAESHNEWFLWKADQLGVNLHPTRDKWREVIPLHDEIKRGWNPAHISFNEWRRLMEAVNWHRLLHDCQTIQELENHTPVGAWAEIVEAIERWKPWVSDYEFIKRIKTDHCNYELLEVIETVESRGQPAYEIIQALKSQDVDEWYVTIEKWREVIDIVNRWTFIPISQIIEDLRGIRDEMSEVIETCKPLGRFIKDRFDEVLEAVNRFIWEVECGCSDDLEELYLYSELNHLYFQKSDTETDEFFRRLSVTG